MLFVIAISHRKQCKRYDVPGDAHYFTFSCFRRLPLLSRDRSRNWLIEAIELGRTKSPFDLWAYVIMPEHVHLILLPKHNARISGVLTTSSVRDIHEKVRYIHENLVRRGLVDRPTDWRWSSASAWETGNNEPLPIDRHSLPPLTILDDDQMSSLMH